MAYIQREGLQPVGSMLTPALGIFSETQDTQLIKMMVVEEKKEGVEAPQEMDRSRDGLGAELSCIFSNF